MSQAADTPLSKASFGKLRRPLRRAVLSTTATIGLLVTGFIAPAYADSEASVAPAPFCETLTEFEFPSTTITSAEIVPTGTLAHRGASIDEHCLVTGLMNERVSEVDGQEYAIGFEMRLPDDWSGQYLYQGNGGLDGAVTTALGAAGGSESALQMGMAVISSDAGHSSNQNPGFGIDPQARLDYGYQAVGTLTPMAKALIETAYGKEPEYSYMAGSSNGGRHAMVGASRYTADYDGFLAVAPGFNLPQAATAQLWGAQQWDTLTTNDDLNSAFTQEERNLVANAVLEQCDALDGLEDGMVFDSATCQEIFDVTQHVTTCDAERDGTCLSEDQQRVITDVFNGATTSDGSAIYASFPYDPGMVADDWASWKFGAPINRDSVAVGYIFSTPPYAPDFSTLRDFVLGLDIDEANKSIYASSGAYSESAMEFMTPPDLDYQDLKASGGKMLVLHGASDGVFSMQDTAAWYQDLQATHGASTSDFVQYYEIPGMTHTRGGPATDQHNSLTALTAWVENGQQPGTLTAWVNPANESLPSEWSQERSRPLCAYPQIAFYTGGDIESASSFECQNAAAPTVLDPKISLDPVEARPGETVTISGTGYTPNSSVTALMTDSQGQEAAEINDIPTDAEGAFTTTWQIPADHPAQELTVTVTDNSESGASASAVLKVLEAIISPSPSSSPDSPSPTESASDDSSETASPDKSPTTDSEQDAEKDDLPVTGASGLALLVTSAIGLLALGIGVLIYARKRRAHH